MGSNAHLNAIEGLAGAIRATNKSVPDIITHKSLVVLISLYNATEQGQVMNKNRLLERMTKLGNVGSYHREYQTIWGLIRRGYIEQDREGRNATIRLSMAGMNYVKGVERYLQNQTIKSSQNDV